ncbi:MAG TPA: hypothetical protein VG937_00415 [Polyangiaceae bacterium]|nr:hypothetical protein [Polyangiaceae bacterium]
MTRSANAGANVPAWLLDAQQLGATLDELSRALRRPPSFSAGVSVSSLAYDAGSIAAAIVEASDAARADRGDPRA